MDDLEKLKAEARQMLDAAMADCLAVDEDVHWIHEAYGEVADAQTAAKVNEVMDSVADGMVALFMDGADG